MIQLPGKGKRFEREVMTSAAVRATGAGLIVSTCDSAEIHPLLHHAALLRAQPRSAGLLHRSVLAAWSVHYNMRVVQGFPPEKCLLAKLVSNYPDAPRLMISLPRAH